ncbi:MAG: cytochrome c oxidase subunit II [Dehalococcoidia bacterium]
MTPDAVNDQSKHLIAVAILWIVLTAIGIGLAAIDIYPVEAAEFADESDKIFRFLMFLGMPVLTFVFAVIAYAVLRFKTGNIDDVGPPIKGTGMVPRVWLGVTGALAIFVMIYPGLVGVADLRKNGDDYGFGPAIAGDRIEVNVTAFQWAWRVEYPEQGITLNSATDEMVLPVHSQVVFRITSSDVVHSFWIPAFRMKIDAIPGRTTMLVVEPTRTGDYASDAAYRVQCAELCGLDHSDMVMHLRVVEEDEFEQWLASKGSN